MATEADFEQWSKEMDSVASPATPNKLDEIFQSTQRKVVLSDGNIDLALTLQSEMQNSPPDSRYDMGMMALNLLNGQSNPMAYQDFIVRSERAFLPIFEEGEDIHEAHAIRYGGMRLAGRVGMFTLGRFDYDWTLALQMHEPVLLSADSDTDYLYDRLPAPLVLPVTDIRPPFLHYKRH